MLIQENDRLQDGSSNSVHFEMYYTTPVLNVFLYQHAPSCFTPYVSYKDILFELQTVSPFHEYFIWFQLQQHVISHWWLRCSLSLFLFSRSFVLVFILPSHVFLLFTLLPLHLSLSLTPTFLSVSFLTCHFPLELI